MQETFKKIQDRYQEVEILMTQEETMRNPQKYTAIHREYKELSKIITVINLYQKNEKNLHANNTLLQTEEDEALIALAKEERTELEQEKEALEQTIKTLLLPKDPNDDKNIILELRAGTGGDEAAIWTGDLIRMYQRFAESRKWKIEILSFTEGPSGGYKEIISNITGENVYKHMKYESGVHRVQRIPNTETQGRIHTSAASVVVLPEIDDIDIEININEVKKETFCSSGPGGQSVNTTYSAVRLTHLPTGITVSCQDGKSQIKNLEKALKVLRARLYERARKEQQAKIGQERRSIIGSGDRSVKIRTYNFPRSWVNDHRIGYTTTLPPILNGDLNALIEALHIAANTEKLTHIKENA